MAPDEGRPAASRTDPPDGRPATVAPGWPRVAALLADLAERSTIIALYAWLASRVVDAYRADGRPASFLLLASDGIAVVFLILRRPSGSTSARPSEWLMALGATGLPLLVAPGAGASTIPTAVGEVVLLMGIVIQVHAKLALGRSFGCVPAHRGLVLRGPYRMVRHPMYAGYLLGHLAFLAMNATPRNLAVYAASYALQVPRILAEERLLRGDPADRAYCLDVRSRLIPGLF